MYILELTGIKVFGTRLELCLLYIERSIILFPYLIGSPIGAACSLEEQSSWASV